MMQRTQYVRRRITRCGCVRVSALLLSVVVVLLLVGSGSASAGEAEVPAPLADAVSEALVVWEEFATTGDTAALVSVFAVGGPQYRQLDAETSAWKSTDSLEPFHFTVRDLQLRSLGPEVAAVWVRVETSRVGFESQVFSWDFDLIQRDGRWRVWTVVAAERPIQDITVLPGPEPSTNLTTSTTAARDARSGEREHTAVAPIEPASPSQPSAGVRLPALSAWIIVFTVAGVALAGYLAPRLDRGREQ